MSDVRSDHPLVVHRLAVAFRFVDAFSLGQIGTPLDVTAPSLPFVPSVLMPKVPWTAIEHRNLYRFATHNGEAAPTGPIDFAVSDPSGVYASFEKISVVLPLPVSSPPVPADFLVEQRLWPTRRFRPPSGETSVVMAVRSAGATDVAGLRVRLWKHTGGPPPPLPYTYTNAGGEALVRLLGPDYLRTSTSGPTVQLDVRLETPPLYAVAVPISAPALPISIDLGTANVLFLDIP